VTLLRAALLVAGALVFAIRHRAHTGAGTSGHRPSGEESEDERISPDGYIDTFANIVEEAGGRFTTASGERRIDALSAVATNGLLHDDLLGRLMGLPSQ